MIHEINFQQELFIFPETYKRKRKHIKETLCLNSFKKYSEVRIYFSKCEVKEISHKTSKL